MPHVFISYARSTAKEAQAVTAALRGLGHEVWLDDEIPAHRAYADVIEERLREAKAVVVNATGAKPYYYTTNRDAADFGYKPRYSSIEGLLQEVSKLLDGQAG